MLDILKDEKIITEDFVKMDPVMLDADNVNFPLMSAMKTTNTNACSWKDDLHSYIRMHKYEFAFYLEQFNSEKKEN